MAEPLASRALDALPFQTAVLDGAGVIVATNRAWDDFARRNGGEGTSCGVGASYVGVCATLMGDGDGSLGTLAVELGEVAAGRRERVDVEYPCDSPDERRWFLMSASRMEPPGAGAVVTHVDITRRKAQELAIEEFSMGLAHDLKAPLRTSIGLAEMVVRDVEEGVASEELQRHVALLRAAAGRGRAVLEAMVTGLRMERRATLRRMPLQAAVEAALREAGAPLRRAGAEVTVSAGLPDVLADPDRLRHVLVNLLENAAKYRDPGRPLRVAIAEADGEGAAAGHVRLSMTDTGRRIPPERAEEVFDPMRRLDPDPDTEGIGIGLALCRSAVESMGGRIWAEPAEDGGTRMMLTLRRAGAYAAVPPAGG